MRKKGNGRAGQPLRLGAKRVPRPLGDWTAASPAIPAIARMDGLRTATSSQGKRCDAFNEAGAWGWVSASLRGARGPPAAPRQGAQDFGGDGQILGGALLSAVGPEAQDEASVFASQLLRHEGPQVEGGCPVSP